jgi:hypothetical protein
MIHDIDQTDGQIFIATELFEGQTLKQHLRASGRLSLPIDRLLETTIRIAEALSAATVNRKIACGSL